MRTFTLAACVAAQTTALEILDRRSAFRFFGKDESQNRAARANTGFFEELSDDNFQRECLEEQCDKTECIEAAKNDEKFKDVDTDLLWQSLTKACTLPGAECNPRGSSKCIQNWGFRTCVCHTFGFLKKGQAEAVELSAFKASDDYVTPALFHKKTFSKKYGDEEHKDEGDCSEPIDVCELYKTDKEAAEICEKEHEVCKNDVVSSNGEPKAYGKSFPGYVCDCAAGYQRNEENNCVPINPCDSDPNYCPADASCVFDESSFTAHCECKEGGYEWDETSQSCVNIDECKTQCAAGENKKCEDLPGSFNCYCQEGYNLVNDKSSNDGFFCEQNDPCKDNTCPADSTCVANGLFDSSCECNDPAFKYDKDSNSCKAKSCEEANIVCGQNSECIQEENEAATCLCNFGYEQDMISGGCIDINECETECNGEGQICNNLPGDYECSCALGFEKKSGGKDSYSDECVDIDECEDDCDGEGYVCTNTIGSFTCECDNGYIRDSAGYCLAKPAQRAPKRAAEASLESDDCEDSFDENEDDELEDLELDEVDDLADYDVPMKGGSNNDYN